MKTSAPETRSRRGLSIPFAMSLIVHGILVLMLVLLGSRRSEIIQKREFDVLAELEKQREEVVKTNLEEAEDLSQETLKDEISEKLESLLSDELEAQDEEAILTAAQESIQSTVEDLLGENSTSDLSETELAQLEQTAFEQSFESVQRSLDEIRRDALLAEARRYAAETVAPKLKEEIENELEKRVADDVRTDMEKAIDNQRAERANDTRKAIEQARDEVRKLAKAQREVANLTKDTAKAEEKQKEVEAQLPVASESLEKAAEKAAQVGGNTKEKADKLAQKETLSDPVGKAAKALGGSDEKSVKEDIESAAKDLENVATDLDRLSRDAENDGKSTDHNNTDQLAATAAINAADEAMRKAVTDEVRETGVPKAAETIASKMASNLESAGWDAGEFKKDVEQAINEELDAQLSVDAGKVAEKVAADSKVENSAEAAEAASAKLAEAIGAEAASEAIATGAEAATKATERKKSEAVKIGVEIATRDTSMSAEFKSRAARLENLKEKLVQLESNAEEGRPSTSDTSLASKDSSGSSEESSGEGSGPSVAPAAPGNSHGVRRGDGYNAYAKINREVYDRLKAFKENREGTTLPDPDAESATAATASGGNGASKAAPSSMPIPGTVYVESLAPVVKKERPDTLVAPKFEALAFGGAQFQATPLTVDGDLSDWGTLRNPMKMNWTFGGEKLEDGLPLWLRWSPQGIYFAYRVPDRPTIDPSLERAYEGDTFEMWLDVDNLRKESMGDSPYSQQLLFMPFGNVRGKDITFAEIGRGFRGIMNNSFKFADPANPDGKSAAKGPGPDGYVVEGFVDIRALAKPRLKAGLYVAMNFSINRGYDYQKSQQWSMSKSTDAGGYDRPDTWGDVLLLGTDAETRFTAATSPTEESPTAATPGNAMGVEVKDADMNRDPSQRDRLLTSVKVEGSTSELSLILLETGPDTGVFHGSFGTQSGFRSAQANTLSVRGGQILELSYEDSRTSTGAAGLPVSAKLPVALPVMTMTP